MWHKGLSHQYDREGRGPNIERRRLFHHDNPLLKPKVSSSQNNLIKPAALEEFRTARMDLDMKAGEKS